MENDIGFLAVEKLTLFTSKNGFLGMTYDGIDYSRIVPMRILPFHEPERYISLTADGKEIGILKDISVLSAEQADLLRAALNQRYFCPKITAIHSVKEKMGYVYIDASLEGGKKLFAVKDSSRDIRLLDDKRILIFDVDGNRYSIDDLWTLDTKSRKVIETYLF